MNGRSSLSPSGLSEGCYFGLKHVVNNLKGSLHHLYSRFADDCLCPKQSNPLFRNIIVKLEYFALINKL